MAAAAAVLAEPAGHVSQAAAAAAGAWDLAARMPIRVVLVLVELGPEAMGVLQQ